MVDRSAIFSIFLAIALRTLYKSYYESSVGDDHAFSAFFSENYFQARELFRFNAEQAQAELHSIPYAVNDPAFTNLSIDVAILHGNPSQLVVHLSGTHGVEGFAGSAVQSAFLSNYTADSNSPTIVLVHAVNPYGFAALRRVNEHNVDLNRNYLTPEKFAKKQAQDPNQYGYQDISDALNPTAPVQFNALFYPKMLQIILEMGYTNAKKAVVSGNYHFQKGLSYGGSELESNHALIRDFIATHFNLDEITHVAFVDVHTGLGPKGFDTLDVKSRAMDSSKATTILFPQYEGPNVEDGALSGYDATVGQGVNGYETWFPSQTLTVSVMQEFGTVNSLTVLVALRAENAATHYDFEHRQSAAEALRDVFYLKDDSEWKFDVGTRGIAVLKQAIENLAKLDD
ncbi:hypothetical protein THRCLA_10683 [Thraustotheca clavata]|uniref:Secreted protein n=1 Tax=Thraustotheca clavata TaxID=74557 RepID=A0A0A7CMM0_9STRA|nr:secreted protein [Thraustotheca clavata]OQR85541.1 hypothetical protein THRCLA_10683 [Thraustotheca clavata]